MADVLYSPASGAKIAPLKKDSVKSLDTAVKKARAAQREWASLPPRQLKKKMLKMRSWIVENADDIVECISDCTGKIVMDAFVTEVFPATLASGYYAAKLSKMRKPRRVGRSSLMFFNKKTRLMREPWGVIGVISPWNYPFGIPFHEVFMALAGGNAVVLKTATLVQPVGGLFIAMARYAELPDGLLSVVNIPGSEAGKAFLQSGINKLFFTGSVAVGRELMKIASENLVPLSLELGGNDAMIVCADADPYRAAGGAVWGGISNCGQSCGGVERIYVLDEIYDRFMAELGRMVKSLRQGGTIDSDFGSLATEKQKKTVEAHIRDALKKGAVIHAQSPQADGGYYHPAVVLADVSHDMDVMKHETFGPVLPVCRVKTEEEAVRLANDSYLGLTASVWTKSKKRAARIASQLEAGSITVNDHLMSHGMAESPWGGYKMSSIGRSHGGPGLEEVFQSKAVISDTTRFLPRNIWWSPYSQRVYDGMKAAMLTFFGKGPFAKLASALKLVGFYLKRVRK